MILLKIIYHLNTYITILFFRLIYAIGGGELMVGKGISLRKGFSVMIAKGGEIRIGDNVFFNNYCSLNANEKISIGKGTIFGENVKVYDHNHCYRDLSKPIKEQGFTSASVSIGSHCWIASNVVVLKGVTIGDNCVIGAGSVVYKDVAPNTIIINKQNMIVKSTQ